MENKKKTSVKDIMQKLGTAIKSSDGRWRLTPKGYLVSNTIITNLLTIQETTRNITRQ